MSRGHARESARGPTKGPAQRGPTQRSLRAGELVRHAIAEILTRGEVHDPVIETHLITVPEVRMSPDLRIATVYVLPLGGQESSREKYNATVLAALDRNKRHLRAEIARRVNLKFAPDIRFRIDERFDEAERIDRLLRSPQVRRDLDNDDSGGHE
jgi:ribosome-binding factor A